MTEDNIQTGGDAADDQIYGEQELSGDIRGASEGIETRTLIFLDGQFEGRADEALVNKVETTNAENGLKETTEIRLKAASGCGCILHTGAEAAVACLSCRRLRKEPLILCKECAQKPENICYICTAASCYNCRREKHFLDAEKRVVCKACVRSTLRVRLLKQIIKWLIIAAGIYYIIAY
jgi:hypothetical protein